MKSPLHTNHQQANYITQRFVSVQRNEHCMYMKFMMMYKTHPSKDPLHYSNTRALMLTLTHFAFVVHNSSSNYCNTSGGINQLRHVRIYYKVA
jgi:hypothetical protein